MQPSREMRKLARQPRPSVNGPELGGHSDPFRKVPTSAARPVNKHTTTTREGSNSLDRTFFRDLGPERVARA